MEYSLNMQWELDGCSILLVVPELNTGTVRGALSCDVWSRDWPCRRETRDKVSETCSFYFVRCCEYVSVRPRCAKMEAWRTPVTGPGKQGH